MTDRIEARKEELNKLLEETKANLEANSKTLSTLQRAISDDEMRVMAINNRLDELELLISS
jgi:predicted  nucleic acid-binding Zn-ribbon protein